MIVNYITCMTVVEKIRSKIEKSKDGSLFFVNSFPQYDEEYVGKILADLCRLDIIIRVAFGIYLKPVRSKFGVVYPSIADIVLAISKRDNAQILPTGNAALNQLGLSTQVPMNSEYITSGSSRVLKIGKRTIKLKRSVPKNFAYKGKLIPVMVQALKAIGRDNLTDEHIGVIRKRLMEYPEERTWRQDVQLAPMWIRKIILNIKESLENEQVDR